MTVAVLRPLWALVVAGPVVIAAVGSVPLEDLVGAEDDNHAPVFLSLLQREVTRAGPEVLDSQQTPPPPPNDEGLTAWDKDMISDDQSGPNWDATAAPAPQPTPAPIHVVAPTTAAPTKATTTSTAAPVPATAETRERRSTAIAAGSVLFGFAAFICAIVWVVHPVPRYRGRVITGHDATTRKIAMAIFTYMAASFCASLLLWFIQGLWLHGASVAEQGSHHDLFVIATFFVIYGVVQLALYIARSDNWSLYTIGTFGGILAGLSLADAIVSVERHFFILDSASTFLLSAVVLMAVLVVVTVFLANLRYQVHDSLFTQLSDVFHGEGWEAWKEQSTDSDVAVVGIAGAFLIYQFVCFSSTGELHVDSPFAGYSSPTANTDQNMWVLLWGGVLLVIGFLCVLSLGYGEHHREVTGLRQTVMLEHLAECALLMTLAWCGCCEVQAALAAVDAEGDALSTLLTSPWQFPMTLPAPEGYLVGSAVLVAVGISVGALVVAAATVAALRSHGEHLQVQSQYGFQQLQVQPVLISLGIILGKAWSLPFLLTAAALGEAYEYGIQIGMAACVVLGVWLMLVLRFYVVPHTTHRRWIVAKAAEVVEEHVYDAAHGFFAAVQSHLPGRSR